MSVNTWFNDSLKRFFKFKIKYEIHADMDKVFYYMYFKK